MAVQVPMIDAAGVTAALPTRVCIDLMEEALRAYDRGDTVQPMRSVIQLPDGSGSLYSMPAFIAEPRSLAVKLITIFHGNEHGPLPTHQGVVVVFHPQTGAPALLIDAARLTAIRTAAVSGVATRRLARADAEVLAVLGTGVQARSHIEAMPLVRPIRELRIWGRSTARAQQLAHEVSEDSASGPPEGESLPAAAAGAAHGYSVVVCDSTQEAVTGADIVCTTTAAREPVLHGRWLKPGAHINAVGASTADARELDSAAVARARIFVDSIDAALTEAGDLLIPMREHLAHATNWSPIGTVLNDRAAGRESENDITLFKSVGLAIEDAAAAAYIARHAPSPGGG